MVVLSAYKQIRAQSTDVLSDIDEDNYDRAFAFLRPGPCKFTAHSKNSADLYAVIQGASDMGTRLSETELQKSLDFCVNLFNPTSPELHERISQNSEISKELFDVTAPLMNPAAFESTLRVNRNIHKTTRSLGETLNSSLDLEASSDSEKATETRMVLNKINARRVVHSEYAINNLESEPLGGYVVKLERGKLGLVKMA